ncbi:MAG: hypothetical protein ABI760_15000 [Ferruginibacter sp.]
MIVQGQVGVIATTASISPNTQAALRQGNMGDAILSELHGRYYETNYRRALFGGAIVGQVTTVGLATTYTGLCLSNPVGSTVNVVITKCAYSFIVAFAAGAFIGLMTGYNSSTNVTHTTPVTPRSQFFGVGASGTALLDSAATLPTAPTVSIIFDSGLTGAITTSPNGVSKVIDLEGSIILPAGAYCAFYTSTASGAAGGAFSFQYEEVPV